MQIPECLYRFFALNIHGDFISFTLGPWGHFDLGIYAIYGSALIVARDAVSGVKWHHILFVVLLFAVSIIGEIKALAISIPIISAVVVFITLRQKKARKYFLMVALPVVFVILVYVAITVWERVHMYSGNTLAEYLEKISFFVQQPTVLVDVEKVDVSSSRFLGSAYVWHYLRTNVSSLVFGLGPGALLAGNFLGTPGRIFEEIPYLNQVAVVLGEVGIVGVLIFLWMLINLLKPVIRLNRVISNEQLRIVCAAFIGMWVFYTIMGPFYDLVWRHDSPNFIFYFFAAYLHGRWLIEESRGPKGDTQVA